MVSTGYYLPNVNNCMVNKLSQGKKNKVLFYLSGLRVSIYHNESPIPVKISSVFLLGFMLVRLRQIYLGGVLL